MIYINKPNQRGGTTIFMTMIILSAILVVSLSASSMILNGMKYNKTRYDSTKAFYAAETGAEQVMWRVRKGDTLPQIGITPIASGYCSNSVNNYQADFCFDDINGEISECVGITEDCIAGASKTMGVMTNGADYSIEFKLLHNTDDINRSSTTLMSIGVYKDEVRKIKLTYRSGE